MQAPLTLLYAMYPQASSAQMLKELRHSAELDRKGEDGQKQAELAALKAVSDCADTMIPSTSGVLQYEAALP